MTNLDPVDPETSDAWELGLKSYLFDKTMMLNIAVFHTEYSDFQAESFIDDGSGDGTGAFVLSNAGEVTTEGVEVDFSWRPMDSLTFFGGLSYIDAQIDDYKNGPCSFGQIAAATPPSCATAANGGTSSQDLSGGELPNSPDWRVTLNALYRMPLDDLPFGLALRGNYRWQDDVLFTIAQDEGTIQDSYGILDLSLELHGDDENYSATLFVKNVTDEFYVSNIASLSTAAVPGGGYSHIVPKSAERTVGVDLRYRW